MEPFKDLDLGKLISAQWECVENEINKITKEELLANDAEILAENIYQKCYIEPVTILEEDINKRSIFQGEVERYLDWFNDYERPERRLVPGVKAHFFYPFIGDSRLFRCYASIFNLGGYPDIEVYNNELLIYIGKTNKEVSAEDADKIIMKEQRSILKQIKEGVEDNNKHILAFNNTLKQEALKKINKKKDEAKAFINLAQKLEIPINKGEYVKQYIDIKRRILPTKKKYDSQPYYEIGNQEYKDILLSIKHTLSTYERTPASYKSMNEEDLRNTLLATLNATYFGEATGETFRNNGKTDICIERDNRAAFIAECKVWGGKSLINKSIEQLDGYRTWRDCKVALIFFVRRKNFLKITEEISEDLRGIENMRSVNQLDRNEYDCKYVSKSHDGQIVNIRVMLFNLYTGE